MASDFTGEALPEGAALELGDGYRLHASMARYGDRARGGEGDLERTDRGDEEGAVERSDSGEDGVDDVRGADQDTPSILGELDYAIGKLMI